MIRLNRSPDRLTIGAATLPDPRGLHHVTTDAKVLRADRFAEIGAVIQRDAGVIIERWCQRSIQEQSQARRVHYQVLLDHLPAFLDALGRGLIESGDPFNRPHYQTALEHGEQRWETGWSLNEVCRDYQILRLVLLDYLDEALERSLRLREIQAVGLALDEAIEASVARYTQFCEGQFHQQAESLREADRRKNQFLATLAHELRNPLAPMQNSLDALRLGRSDPSSVEQVRDIMDRQVRQMTRLVDDLLDMSRIALGKLELRKERIDLKAVLQQAVQMNAPLAAARRHAVTVELPTGAMWVEGDQARLIQVFVNLLNNAVKFTPENGQLTLSATSEGDQAIVRVCDDGVGIPNEMLTKIFDLFTQVDAGSGSAPGGLGIGLSLVRQLVELHGGAIVAANSGSGQGSEFTVTFPLVNRGAVESNSDSSGRQATAGRRILLIEDNADGRRSMEMLLKLLGHEIVTAENGARGIEAALAVAPDVALIDIGLPDMDGYQVATRLKSELGSRTVLVALTGFSQPEDRERAITAGFDSHLTKPVDLQTLQELLASLAPPRHA
jgi:signal transduction histidine kinase